MSFMLENFGFSGDEEKEMDILFIGEKDGGCGANVTITSLVTLGLPFARKAS